MKSMFVIDDDAKRVVYQYMNDLKIIVVKGVGYIAMSKKNKLTPELLRNLAISMENQNIKEV